MNTDSVINVSSVNCRGLRDIKKRTDVIDYLKNLNSNIICLQDTHWLTSEERAIRKLWNNPCYVNGSKRNARGVAILLRNNFEYKIIDKESDADGNFLILEMKISNDFTLKIINLYGPNMDSPEFFENIKNKISLSSSDYHVLCGDFNLILDPTMDSHNYNNVNNPRARREVLSVIDQFKLKDIYRYLNPYKKRYSWRKYNPLVKQARLDYFFISETLVDLVSNSDIIPGYRTDHSIIQLSISLNNFVRGKGIWKFNTSLLKDNSFSEMIHKTIEDEKVKYAVPVYLPDQISAIHDKDIQFTISDKDFLQILLVRLRGECIRYSSIAKKQRNKVEIKHIQEIEEIEKNPNFMQLTDLLNDKKFELEENDQITSRMARRRGRAN